MVPGKPHQGYASTSGYNYPYYVTTISTGYVTGGTLTINANWTSNWNGTGYSVQEAPWSPVHAINRKQRRLLESNALPTNAIQMAEVVYGRRGERYKLAKWDQLFFAFWFHMKPKHRMEWRASRAHSQERFTSPLRRFTGGKLIIRKP